MLFNDDDDDLKIIFKHIKTIYSFHVLTDTDHNFLNCGAPHILKNNF